MRGRGLCVPDLPPPPPGRFGWPWTEAPAPRWRGDEPRITVVTPSYQQGAFLEETLRSVLLQGHPNLEYIVVDGGSDDGSVEIIRRYEPFLARWRSGPDGGQARALNEAFAGATGELRAYLNSDDVYEPGALRAASAGLRAGHRWMAGDVRYRQPGVGSWPFPQASACRIPEWFVTCPVAQPGTFWTADLQRAAGPFREDLACAFDYEFWLRLRIVHGVVPARLRRPTAVYRLHPASKTMGRSGRFEAEVRRVRARYTARLPRLRRAENRIVRRQWRARYRGGRALSHLRRGEWSEARRELACALRLWPLLFADRAVVLALREILRPGPQERPPEVWPNWESF